MRRLFVIGDVGGPAHYHLGDEAMLEANLAVLRRLIPNLEFTAASADAEWTAQRYGVAGVKLPLGERLVDSLADCCGVVISGGGNLCAAWPEKVEERALLLEQAQAIGLPTVLLGQTIGPHLTYHQRLRLGEPLARADWIGVRDDTSAAVAVKLGAHPDRVHRQFDDAYFLDGLPVTDERAAALQELPQPWILITLDAGFSLPSRAQSLDILASQIDGLAESLNASLIFVPHAGGTETAAELDDRSAGRALRDRLSAKLLLLDLWEPREVRWLTERAAMVISTRYHPLVFATSAGIPSLGIWVDAYTRAKFHGALSPAGLEGWSLPIESSDRGALLPLARELWRKRDEISARLARTRAGAWPKEQERWEGVVRTLRFDPQGSFTSSAPTAPAYVYRESRPIPGAHASRPHITAEQWHEYERVGYLRLGRILDASQLAKVSARIDDIMLGRVAYPAVQLQLDTGGPYEALPDPTPEHKGATLAYRKLQGLEADPLILEVIQRELFREICARHYGAHASISIFRVMMMNKSAGKGTHLPWHQDGGDVWKLDRDPLVTSWIALDPAKRENGCVQVIPGSHRLGLLSGNGSTLSAEHVAEHCPPERIEYLELEAGEGLLLHNWLLHCSDVNRSGAPRRALSACYMDGRTVGTLTGTRYPIVFGTHEETDSALAFVQRLLQENADLREMAMEAQRYTQSLLEDRQRREKEVEAQHEKRRESTRGARWFWAKR